MASNTITARQLDAGSVIILPNGTRRTVAAVDDTATHVYLDFADGGSGIYALDDAVTVERPAKPLASMLTGREYVRVQRVTGERIGRNPERTKAEYLAELWITARDLYPGKVA